MTAPSGSGRTHRGIVVLVHGSFMDSRVWAPQVEGLSSRWRVVAARMDGFYPDRFDATRFSAERHVAQIVELIRNLEGPVHLVGHSRGGRIALNAAASAGDALASLVLIEPGGVREPDFMPPSPVKGPVAPSFMAQALEKLAAGDADGAMRLAIDGGHGAGTWDGAPALVREAGVVNAVTMTAVAADTTAPLSRSVAARITAPTLLLEGEETSEIFARTHDVLERIVPDVRRIRVAGADHFLPLTHRNDVNAALEKFFIACEERRTRKVAQA